SGLVITQDGVELVRAAWGMALPVDPGEHQIEARAPGKKPWTRYIVTAPGADRQELEVSPLEDEVHAAARAPAPLDVAPRAPASSGRAAFGETTAEEARVRWEARVTAHGVGATLSADW